jgi:hypothetical protein
VIITINELPYSQCILQQISDPVTDRSDQRDAMRELADSSTYRLDSAVDSP